MNCISTYYKEIDNSSDFLNYFIEFYNITQNKKNSRNYYTVLESLITKIEENCIIPDYPLKKYRENMKIGIECPFLLNYLFLIILENIFLSSKNIKSIW